MKNFILVSLTLASLAVISPSLLAQDDSVPESSEETRQDRREALRQLTKQERDERRIAAREQFESLSEAEQAQVRESRQQRQQARRAEFRSLRRASTGTPSINPDSSPQP